MSAVQGRSVRSRPVPPPALGVSPHLSGGRAPGWWGMVALIVTEGVFFTILLTSYWFIRFRSGPTWPPDGIAKPELSLVGIMTPILLLSSVPMHWAQAGIRKGRARQLEIGLILTFLMGATFLGLQGVEYARSLKDFSPRTDAYGTLFYSITGFHGIHVGVGLLLNLWLQVQAFRGRFSAERLLPVENVVMYWHFVDAVWVFIFASLYLAPHVWP